MSQAPLLAAALLAFQAGATACAATFGVARVDAYVHSSASHAPRFYCRYQVVGERLERESPAGKTPGAALKALREALAQHLGHASPPRAQ